MNGSFVGCALALVLLAPLPARPQSPRTTKAPDTNEQTKPAAIVALRGAALAPDEEPLPNNAEVRIGSTRFRHPIAITAGAMMAGHFLVTTHKSTFTVTDTRTGRRLYTQDVALKGWFEFSPLHAQASPDGRSLLLRSAVEACLWSWQDHVERPLKFIGNLPLPENVDFARWIGPFQSLQFAPDSQELYLVGHDVGLFVYDVATAHLRRQHIAQGTVVDLALKGKRFLAVSPESYQEQPFWMGGLGRQAAPVFRFKPKVSGQVVAAETNSALADFRPDLQEVQLVELHVYDAGSGRKISTIHAPRAAHDTARNDVLTPKLSPDGKYLAWICQSDAMVWNVDNGSRVLQVKPTARSDGAKELIDAIGFSSDSRHFFVSSGRGKEQTFNLKAVLGPSSPNTIERIIAAPGDAKTTRRSSPFIGAAFERFVASAGDESGPTQVGIDPKYSVIARRDSRGAKQVLPPGYASVVMDVTRDGRLIAVGDRTGRIDLWGTDGRFVRNLSSSGPRIFCVVFSPDGKRVAASDEGRRLRIWPVDGNGDPDSVDVPADADWLYPEQLTFAPDGRRILINKDAIMSVLDIKARSWSWDHAGHLAYRDAKLPLVCTPDGKRFIAGKGGMHYIVGNDCLRWLDVDTGQAAHTLHLQKATDPEKTAAFSALAISPDGQYLAVVLDNAHLQVLDSVKGFCIREFCCEHTSFRSSILRFSSDGRRLATCDYHGRVSIWEVATGELAHTLEYPNGAIDDLRFGPDSRTLITSNHREVVVWSLRPSNVDKPPLEMRERWRQLGPHEAAKAERARWAFLDDPARTVAFLKATLPAPSVEDDEIQRWLDALDAPSFRKRDKAAKALLGLGRMALPLFHNPLPPGASPEARQRLESLRRELSAGPTAEERRHARAVEILELIGTPDAWDLLEVWLHDAALTDEAQRAFDRRRDRK